ncbi:MAG: hypothetical protein M3O33_16270 [Cyanobacteriota bacterium]|nr:hypothetical protein [Cyanobacteriota bacterium]
MTTNFDKENALFTAQPGFDVTEALPSGRNFGLIATNTIETATQICWDERYSKGTVLHGNGKYTSTSARWRMRSILLSERLQKELQPFRS